MSPRSQVSYTGGNPTRDCCPGERTGPPADKRAFAGYAGRTSAREQGAVGRGQARFDELVRFIYDSSSA